MLTTLSILKDTKNKRVAKMTKKDVNARASALMKAVADAEID